MTTQQPEEERRLNFVGFARGGERYLFFFDDASFGETQRVFRRFARNPDLSFSWFEAAKLGEAVQGLQNRRSGDGEDSSGQR